MAKDTKGRILTAALEMFTHIFAGRMDKGLILRDNPAMLAFAYTTPISALIRLCDGEPEKTEEAIAQIEKFSRHFVTLYCSEKTKPRNGLSTS